MVLKPCTAPAKAIKVKPTASKVKTKGTTTGTGLNPTSLAGKAVVVLAELHMLGITYPTIKFVMNILGTTKEQSFMVLISKERSNTGFLALPGNKTIAITEAGLAAVTNAGLIQDGRPTTDHELQSSMKRFFKLTGKKGEIFDCLARAGRGKSVHLDDIVKCCRHEGKNMSSFKTYLGALTGSAGLAIREGESFRLSDTCFLK
jgi:hypothetical protein